MGTPMITAGDESGRSQQGHDNAYDQDNAISWLPWSSADESLRGFVQHLIQMRRGIPWLQHGRWPDGELQVHWLRPDGQPLVEEDWTAPRTHLALLGALDGQQAVLLLNAGDEPISYVLPGEAGQPWTVTVRTDCEDRSFEPSTAMDRFDVPARAVSLLVGPPGMGEA
jgi:glycogen operon protein